MSYEGINHKLCANGHYHAFDAVTEMYEGSVDQCEHCKAPFTWEFAQDYTNGSDPKYPYTMPPDMSEYVIEAAPGETCNLGHFHPTGFTRYKVPDNGLWRKTT